MVSLEGSKARFLEVAGFTTTADQILDRLAGYCSAVIGTEYRSDST